MGNRPKVEINRARGRGRAWCEGCDLLQRPGTTRSQVRQHTATTGHITHYVISDVTTYYPLETPEVGS